MSEKLDDIQKGLIFIDIGNMGHKVFPCGSKVTCNPIPEDTDEDYLICISANTQQSEKRLISDIDSYLDRQGFINESDDDHYQDEIGDTFASYRRDNINLIVSSNSGFCEKHKLATAVCKKLNLLNKADRIVLFQAFLYGSAPK